MGEKIITIALVLVLVLGFVGCVGSCSDSGSSSSSSYRPSTAEEAASHYYYDKDGHIHRDY